MAQTFSQEHLQELMVFPFRNPRWKSQLAIGGLLTLANFVVRILPMSLVYGYSLQIVRGIVQERQLPSMPLWDDWGRLLTDGLRALVVRIVFIAPAVLLILVGYALSMALSIGPARVGSRFGRRCHGSAGVDARNVRFHGGLGTCYVVDGSRPSCVDARTRPHDSPQRVGGRVPGARMVAHLSREPGWLCSWFCSLLGARHDVRDGRQHLLLYHRALLSPSLRHCTHRLLHHADWLCAHCPGLSIRCGLGWPNNTPPPPSQWR